MLFVILPFTMPSILAALFLTAAVSFDEFMIAFFVGGVNETLPVRVLKHDARAGEPPHQRGRQRGVRGIDHAGYSGAGLSC